MCVFSYLFQRKQNSSKIYPDDYSKRNSKILRDFQKLSDVDYKKCYRSIVVNNST